MKPRLEWLLVFVPVAIAAKFLGAPPLVVFGAAGASILPLAGAIGHGTEEVAAHSSPQVGGLLNATFGNITELVIAFFLILEGEPEIVKASITGSIIGNVLLVLGLSFIAGGWSRQEQTFNRASATLHSTGLIIALSALLMPALFSFTPEATNFRTEAVSAGVSVLLITLYGLGLLFTLKTNKAMFRSEYEAVEPKLSLARALFNLTAATATVAFMSEMLVGALEPAVEELGISKLFVGLILVPIIGNAAEHSSAIVFAAKNKMDVSIEIAIGSSTQIALLIAPLLVFLSLAVGKPMDFIFSGFEIAAVGLSAAIMAFIALDARSNWLEGAQLVGVYLVMAVSFFFL